VSRWQAIVFDLDDTLYPERDYVLSGFRAVAAWAETHLSIPTGQGFTELKRLYEQGVRGDTFDRWLAAHRMLPDALVPQLVQVYREHEPRLTPFPEVPELLDSLHRRYRMGLLTDGYLAVQKRKLDALGLARHFDAIVFSDEWGREAWKPNTKPFEAALQRLGVDASSAVYIAYNPLKDFVGARQVGLTALWVRRAGGEYVHQNPPTSQHAADLMISSLSELEQALTQLERP